MVNFLLTKKRVITIGHGWLSPPSDRDAIHTHVCCQLASMTYLVWNLTTVPSKFKWTKVKAFFVEVDGHYSLGVKSEVHVHLSTDG